MRILRLKRELAFLAALFVLAGPYLFPQPSPAGRNRDALLKYLNQTIAWYRQLDFQKQMATDPDEELTFQENQQVAGQIVSLAFEFARAEAEAIEREESQSGGIAGDGGPSHYQALRQMLDGLEQQVKGNQVQIESLRRELAGADGKRRESLQTRIAEIQSELDLAQARRDSLRSMAEFVGGTSANGLGATGIREKIEALARSVPGAFIRPSAKQEGTPTAEQAVPSSITTTRKTSPTGIWALTSDVFSLSGKMRTLKSSLDNTDALSRTTKELRAPLVDTLRELSKMGDELASRPETSEPFVLIQQKAIFDALTVQFKRASGADLPLSKQGILLELYRKNLTNWQEALGTQYSRELQSLLFRLLMLVVVLTIIFGSAELWRRAIFRYVGDVRRRYQYLLLRKIILWCVIAIVFLFSFASELSSAATFAGLITAGIAVALQNVILSVVAYFFLIGRFGIRVGDRVQVAGVTGEVVDIGLVRFHMLELVSGGEKTASGRVVAFSNSIVFQANAGLFKQIPGTSFVWHEITLTISSDSDYRLAEERLLDVVTTIFAEYRNEMEKQYHHMEKTLTTEPAGALQPSSRLRPASSGLEVIIRYPVDLRHASEIDDRVTRELLKVIEQEPKLKLAGSGKPPILLKTDISK